MKSLLNLVLLMCSWSLLADEYKALHELDISFAKGQGLPLKSIIDFELENTDGHAVASFLSDWQGIKATVTTQNTVHISMIEQPVYQGDTIDRYQHASFVVDFDEPVMKRFIDGFSPTVNNAEAMEEYVAAYIENTTYLHGFNIASVTAENRSGDCTEYAVLLAALARANGLHARVILGTAIMEDAGQLGAFGHAWTEIWHNEQWQLFDSALYPLRDSRIFYLPSGVLKNEGPGFGFALASSIANMPREIEQVKTSD